MTYTHTISAGDKITFDECLTLSARYTAACERMYAQNALEGLSAASVARLRCTYAWHRDYWQAAALEALLSGEWVIGKEDGKKVQGEELQRAKVTARTVIR